MGHVNRKHSREQIAYERLQGYSLGHGGSEFPDRAIDAWCASVWEAYSHSHQAVAELLRQHGIV